MTDPLPPLEEGEVTDEAQGEARDDSDADPQEGEVEEVAQADPISQPQHDVIPDDDSLSENLPSAVLEVEYASPCKSRQCLCQDQLLLCTPLNHSPTLIMKQLLNL